MKDQREQENIIPRKIQLILLFILGYTSLVWAFHFPTYSWFTTSVQTGMIELKTAVEISMEITRTKTEANTLTLQYNTNSTAETIKFEFEISGEASKYVEKIEPGSVMVENLPNSPSQLEVNFEFQQHENENHPHFITMVKPQLGSGSYQEEEITLTIKYYINDSTEPTGDIEIEGITLWVPQSLKK